MDRAILSQRITSIISDLNRLTNTLYSLNMTDIQRYPENYEVLSIDAAHRAEVVACRLRHLIYQSTPVRKENYLAAAAEVLDISIDYRDGIVEITLPCLIPNKKRWKSCEFLLDPFHAALHRYAEEHTMPCFRHCVICFSHVYSKEHADRRVQDYDNVEQKKFLDVAASYILTDDTGLLCDAYQTTELGERDCTHISIMDSQRFPQWLDERQTTLRSIEDL